MEAPDDSPRLEARRPGAAPRARRHPHVSNLHGGRWVDNYHWLRDRDNPRVLEYLEAENQYTETVMRPTEAVSYTHLTLPTILRV